MAMNIVVLTGRLTRDPELKYGQSGTAYCKFTIAVNRMRRDDPTDFINCAAFGKTAELIGEYIRKGSQLGVQGRIQTSSYEMNGEKRYRTEVVVDRIEFLDSKGSNTSSNQGYSNSNNNLQPTNNSYSAPQPVSQPSYNEPQSDFDDDDEFPF